jgi:hypothetical protein
MTRIPNQLKTLFPDPELTNYWADLRPILTLFLLLCFFLLKTGSPIEQLSPDQTLGSMMFLNMIEREYR